MSGEKVLIVDDDKIVSTSLVAFCREEGLAVEAVGTQAEALHRLRYTPPDILITDVRLPDGSGMDLLRKARELRPDVPVILITGYGSIEDAVCAIKLGAQDYIVKPIKDDVLRLALMRARENRRVYRENHRLRRAVHAPRRLEGLIAHDHRMMRICKTILNIADSDARVLIEGESGTGKTLIARLLHKHSARRDGPFVEVNCAAIPPTLLESELFGHVRGAFTSAYADREGKFQAAHGGTILLDEIAVATPSFQTRLLKLVEESCFTRVGDNRPIHVDVRILTATNQSLAAEVAAGRFREDLYHRLNVVRLSIPPLRERILDIPLLANHFAAALAREHGRPVRPISREAMMRLVYHRWPGNVRELRNVIEHGVVMATGDEITTPDLPAWVARIEVPGDLSTRINPLKQALQEPERRVILGALRLTGWNKSLAACKLGVSRSTLYNKIKEYGLLPNS